MTQQIYKRYEVNPLTMGILSVAHQDYSSIIVELHQQLYVRQNPLEIIKTGCLDGGASYEGRRKAVTHLTGAVQKVPIPINPNNNIFAFPTHSPTMFECNWIFYHHIKSIHPDSKGSSNKSIVTFKNNQSITLNESSFILQKQMQRTAICIIQFSNQHQDLLNYQHLT